MKRPDPGDWEDRPHPRESSAPWWVALRHRTVAGLAAAAASIPAGVWLATGSLEDVAVVTAVVLASTSVPEVRDLVVDQAWRLVLERRLRAALLALRITDPRGRVPHVLRSAARSRGVVVRLWLPVGVEFRHLADRRHRLAELCFVDDVHVERRPGSPSVAEIVLVRRALGRRT
ncbi:hypothetical protein GCM10023201_42050 [Actinomycetospora corticicola]|uniref:Uncharacterized protein n=1 Tax=Actinomycetospora corticicola TaxID=663602 RepID=A0A7Y9DWH7_9PSEU|nr:hypothetical protein [Actinomycetospora corticicola]NYD36706.1 hypothetical protein [Actinomycetospora corticicola]